MIWPSSPYAVTSSQEVLVANFNGKGKLDEEEYTSSRECANSKTSKGGRIVLQRKNDVKTNTNQEGMSTRLDYRDKDGTGLEAIEPTQEAPKKTNPRKL